METFYNNILSNIQRIKYFMFNYIVYSIQPSRKYSPVAALNDAFPLSSVKTLEIL